LKLKLPLICLSLNLNLLENMNTGLNDSFINNEKMAQQMT
jgi:hypothetical protein